MEKYTKEEQEWLSRFTELKTKPASMQQIEKEMFLFSEITELKMYQFVTEEYMRNKCLIAKNYSEIVLMEQWQERIVQKYKNLPQIQLREFASHLEHKSRRVNCIEQYSACGIIIAIFSLFARSSDFVGILVACAIAIALSLHVYYSESVQKQFYNDLREIILSLLH